MASRFFRGLGARGWTLGTRSAQSPQSTSFLFACLAAFAFLITLAAQTPTPDRARTEALARRATERLQALQREADRLASEERTLLGDLRKLEIERQLRAQQLKQVDADAARVQGELDATAARMQSLDAAERSEQPELRARLVEIYKLGQARYLRLLLSTPAPRRL